VAKSQGWRATPALGTVTPRDILLRRPISAPTKTFEGMNVHRVAFVPRTPHQWPLHPHPLGRAKGREPRRSVGAKPGAGGQACGVDTSARAERQPARIRGWRRRVTMYFRDRLKRSFGDFRRRGGRDQGASDPAMVVHHPLRHSVPGTPRNTRSQGPPRRRIRRACHDRSRPIFLFPNSPSNSHCIPPKNPCLLGKGGPPIGTHLSRGRVRSGSTSIIMQTEVMWLHSGTG
jgi:hypothetical protein